VKTQLYEITSAIRSVMAFAIVTLAVAACVAGIIPARRAASIDPVQALRRAHVARVAVCVSDAVEAAWV
jgi:macrolide transport system ATP-binding/permease protein